MATVKADQLFSLKQKKIIGRIVFTLIFLFLVYAAVSNTLFHQLQSPVLKYPYVDPTFWLMHLLQIPDIIVSHFHVAYTFDILLFLSCAACILLPLKRLPVLIFLLIYFIYFITFNSYGGHHTHSRVAILLVPIPFLFEGAMAFTFMWQALRYYTLFLYTSAFLWKLLRFSWLYPNQGILIFKKNLTAYLYFHPETFLSRCYQWLLQHPYCTNILFLTGFFLEGIFVVGFFTKRFDHWLLLFSFLLNIGFWFLADVYFFELLLLSLPLINFYKIKFLNR